MGRKLGIVLGGVAVVMAACAGVAFASDESEANGGHCDYDGVIVAMNDCDTNNNGGGELREANPELDEVTDVLEPLG